MKTFIQSFKITLVLCVFLFVGYVLVLSGVAWVQSPARGAVELVKSNGQIVGANHIGQKFTSGGYFWGRPSAVDYNASASGGSNKSAGDTTYLQLTASRLNAFLTAHPYLSAREVPSELITASGSGLDPHLSPAAVSVQIKRVAAVRGMSEESVARLVRSQIGYTLYGDAFVDVLKLNIALDKSANK